LKRKAEAIADLEKIISMNNNPSLVQAAEKALVKIKKEK
jgi:hypothetical protein